MDDVDGRREVDASPCWLWEDGLLLYPRSREERGVESSFPLLADDGGREELGRGGGILSKVVGGDVMVDQGYDWWDGEARRKAPYGQRFAVSKATRRLFRPSSSGRQSITPAVVVCTERRWRAICKMKRVWLNDEEGRGCMEQRGGQAERGNLLRPRVDNRAALKQTRRWRASFWS